MHDHNKLRAFELADDVAILIDNVTGGFPRNEDTLWKILIVYSLQSK